jgi:hypothetical protein
MTKFLLTISIAILACAGALSGCVMQKGQNNNTNLEDIESPTIPTTIKFTSVMTDTTPTFSWNASMDASGVAGYYVKIDASEDVWVGNILTWESTSIIEDGTHFFYIKAKDASTNGNNGSYGSCVFLINTITEGGSPVADAHGPYVWFVNQNITFDGSKSYDTDGTIVNYTWDLGDGTLLYGKWVFHSYSKVGIYNISLTVVDNNSLVNTNTTIATIQLYSDDDGNQNNGSGGSSEEQEKFLGSWHNQGNNDEHWIFFSNWTQTYSILVTDNYPEEPYTAELHFTYTITNSTFCQSVLIGGVSPPSCYLYEFSVQDTVLTLFNEGAMMVVLIKD